MPLRPVLVLVLILAELFTGEAAVVVPDHEQHTVACVTGASGYLGTELVAQLLASGVHEVRGTVRSLADSEHRSAPLQSSWVLSRNEFCTLT